VLFIINKIPQMLVILSMEGFKMKGFLYRLAIKLKETGERLHISCLIRIGLSLRSIL